MAKQILNTGVSNNDKSGDTLRAGGLKIKANFDEIYAALANDGLNISGGALLKTGSYTDLHNLPEFKELAITASFDDLVDVPELAKYVVTPPAALIGASGDMTGDISSDNSYVYVCTEDYVQQPSYGPLTFLHEENFIDFSLRAATSETDTTAITLKPGSGVPAPSVDWTVTDGTVTRTITLVTEIGDGSGGVWYECTLDGTFTTVANEFYEIQFAPPAGGYVACFTWSGTYQPIVDAHVAGTLAAKLFKTGDTVGRTIAHAVYDSLSNELTIAYTGDQFTNFTDMYVIYDQPQIWKAIPLNANANLGSFKIEGGVLGTTAEAGGWGGSSIYVAPNGEGIAWLYVPNDNDAQNGAATVIGNGLLDGSGVQIQAYNNTWQFGSDGHLMLPSGKTIKDTDGNDLLAGIGVRNVSAPTHSTGASGDLEGDLAFSNGYIYYCTADYGQIGHQVSVATAYNGATSLNTNNFQLTKSADTLQIAVGDIISDSNGGPTSVVESVSSDDNYTYVGTGSFAYAAVFPLTFTSTDYVSGGNIWKRVAWSNDTW